MFLLVSVRHVEAHPDELQHGVSIQSSINLGKTFPRISRVRIIPSTQILARVVVYLLPFISQILDFICRRFWFWFWFILNGVILKLNQLLITSIIDIIDINRIKLISDINKLVWSSASSDTMDSPSQLLWTISID